ncbi:hypothetical protein HDU76_006214 [Blyttiomyces sp. JEL0837]|nr:hypothetical protein HDU76_006214 [Blyttiomyces sp. JEL0837]
MQSGNGHSNNGVTMFDPIEWKSFPVWNQANLDKMLTRSFEQGALPKLALSLKERNAKYQFERTLVFERLLAEYPLSMGEIVKEAIIDIPPNLRGKIWAALLGVYGVSEAGYDAIDKENETPTDRQLDLDIPRCHQYNELLSSQVGHGKLRRILKTWINTEEGQLVYWQEFLKANNSDAIQKAMIKFKILISFLDCTLSTFLHSLGITPEMFAIPWFITMFSHLFPLDKVYHLWDTFLTGPSDLYIYAGYAILIQLRDALLGKDFSGCMLLFSELPSIDVEKCVTDAVLAYQEIPPSLIGEKSVMEGVDCLSGRISLADFSVMERWSLLLDARPSASFFKGHLQASVNIDTATESASVVLKIMAQRFRFTVIIGDHIDQTKSIADTLVLAEVSRVSCSELSIANSKPILFSFRQTYVGANYALQELLTRMPNFMPYSLITYGTGSGAGLWAANELWSATLQSAVIVDNSNDNLNMVETLARMQKVPYFNNLIMRRLLSYAGELLKQERHDLVMASDVLKTITSDEERRRLVDKLWKMTSKIMVLIESNGEEGFKVISDIREHLRGKLSESTPPHFVAPVFNTSFLCSHTFSNMSFTTKSVHIKQNVQCWKVRQPFDGAHFQLGRMLLRQRQMVVLTTWGANTLT